MLGCKDCANALFDERFGDFKCSVKEQYAYNPDELEFCESWKKGIPGVSKENTVEEE